MIRLRSMTTIALLSLILVGWVATAVAGDGVTPAYSAASLFNLGNANARAGRHGAAVLNYERARLLTPDDPDIAANLQIVRAAAHLPTDPPRWLEREHAALTLNPTLMAWLGLLGVLLLGTGLLGGGRPPRSSSPPRLRWRRRLWWLRPVTLPLGAALLGLTLLNARLLWPLMQEAVVLTPAAPVRVTPVPMGDPAFVLAEAETVTIAGQHDDFYLIRTQTGKSGWVARGNVAAVVPRR